MNKSDLAKKILALEGLSDEDKSALLGLLRKQKKYGLVWEDKPEDVEKKLETEIPALREVTDRAIISENPDAPNHILIEGDNLEALTTLSYTHAGKIDVIYIDPPYNRGKKDLRYNDDYIESDNPFKHSFWLNLMAKRLKIAKKLLSDTGVLIAHIDEHEFDSFNLLLRTEIFSEQNCLGIIVWNKLNPKGDANAVSIQHEYILVYCKNKEAFKETPNHLKRQKPNAYRIIRKAKSLFSKLGKTEIPEDVKSVITPFNYAPEVLEDFKVTYDLELINKEFQSWLASSDFTEGEKAYKFIDEEGNAFQPVSMVWPNKETPSEDYFVPLVHPINGLECPAPDKGWRFPSATMRRMLGSKPPVQILPNLVTKGQIVYTTNKKGLNNQPRNKYLLKDNMMENTPSIVNDGSSNDNLLIDLGVQFEYPKTLVIAKYLLKNVLSDYKYVLDFFAGSGTALHATMQLNAEDGGHRTCILATNNENGICENVTYERNRRVIQGYTTPKGEQVAGLTDNNLRYYRTEFVGRRRTPANLRKLVQLSTDMLCIKEDLYTEHATFAGFNTHPQVYRYFSKGDRQMLIIYNEDYVPAIVKAIATTDFPHKIKVYVFSPSEDPWSGEFIDVEEKVELCALPAAILNAYKRVLPKPKDEILEPKGESREVAENLDGLFSTLEEDEQ